jgi:hypothetical protein
MHTAAQNIFQKIAFAFAPSGNVVQDPTNRTTANGTTALEKKGLLKIEHALGRRVCCEAGAVWITLDGDRRDVVLEAGQVFVSDRNATMVITGLDPATISIV